MKRVFVLLTLLGLMGMVAEAKVVRGFVMDLDGNPVEGVKMVVVSEDLPLKRYVASTDAEGFFCVQIPDNVDSSDIRSMFSQNGTSVVWFQDIKGTLRITIEPKPSSTGKAERPLAQK